MAKGMKFKQLRNGEKWGGELFAWKDILHEENYFSLHIALSV
jgi:hypothetical protein